jgi:hypothetical protein
VYVLKNGLNHYIPSPSIFAAHGYNWGNVITISLTELESYVEGPPLTLPEHYKSLDDGDLVKAPNVAAVYLIENGMKRVFVSGGAFTSRGYKWSDIITVDTLLISQHPDGEPLTETVVTEGSLVKSVSSPVVYLIQNGSKRPFTDERSFLTRGYNWYDIRGVSFSELDAVPLGSPMEYEFDDFDQDGLNAADESQYGTDPNEEDTDGDGYLDGQEVYNGYNPLGTGLL